MGIVYEAVDRERGGRVALKTVSSMSATALARFKNEFRALQGIRHRNLVGLRELLEDRGVWFFTMDLIDGLGIHDHLRPTPPDLAVGSTPVPETLLPDCAHTVDTMVSAPSSSNVRRRRASPLDAEGITQLRALLLQLTEGLNALHAAHKVHRDIKPSNILVSAADERAVIVDFGIIADERDSVDGSSLAGTVAYMAPEQARGGAVTAAADWYSVGVLLYHLLTGATPFTGSPSQIMAAKLAEAASPVFDLAPDAPADLVSLCAELLKPVPDMRPTGAQVLERLGGGTTLGSLLTREELFVGREASLATLAAALDRVRAGEPQAILVAGGSGIGKSALVRRYLADVRDDSGCIVLSGRCYERESVPYKGVDTVLDGLSTHLQSLADDERRALLPKSASCLGAVFPAFATVPDIGAGKGALSNDPQEQKLQVVDALRALLANLAEQTTVIVSIDDLQWADQDSLALLEDILRPPDSPAILLLATVRTAKGTGRGMHTPDELARRIPLTIQTITVGQLTVEEAHTLAAKLSAEAGDDAQLGRDDLDAIVVQAAGHPLFIDTLVRHRLAHRAEGAPLRLDDALWERIEQLDDNSRGIVEALAVSGGPLAQEPLARASGLPLRTFDDSIAELQAANLVRTGGLRRSDTVEVYHDRVREAVLAHLSPEARVQHHRRIAQALERSYDRDAEQLAMHWETAGEAKRAAKYVAIAAQNALASLAFDRAATLYETAVALNDELGETRPELRIQFADALGHAGRSAEAAAVYQATAEQVPPDKAVELRISAAAQYLRCGHISDGEALLRDVLPDIGLRYPKTPARALLGFIGRQIQLKRRGFAFEPRKQADLPVELLTRADACSSISTVLSVVDAIRGKYLLLRQGLLSLDLGEPNRVALACASLLTHEASAGPHAGGAATERLREQLRALDDEIADPYVRARIVFSNASVDYLWGHWRDAAAGLRSATELFQECETGTVFEEITSEAWRLNAVSFMGDYPTLAVELPRRLRSYDARADRYGAMNLRCSYANVLLWLARDATARLSEDLDYGREHWRVDGFHIQNWYEFHGRAQSYLYDGDGARALALVTETQPLLKKSFLLRIHSIANDLRILVGRIALCRAAQMPEQRKRHLKRVERCARALAKRDARGSLAWAHALRAAAAEVAGDVQGAVEHYDHAIAQFERVGTDAIRDAVALRASALQQGSEGDERERAATAALAARGVVDPRKFAAMILPGVSDET